MSQDYVISSHVIEHLPDPIGAFIEWTRLLKPGGTIFMIVPHRDALPADKGRPISPMDEIETAYRENYTPDTHPYQSQGRRGHYWVFALESMKELIEMCNGAFGLGWTLVHEEAIDAKVGNGFTLVYRYEPQSFPDDEEYYGRSLVDDAMELAERAEAAKTEAAEPQSWSMTGVQHASRSFTEVTIDLSKLPADEPTGVVTDPDSFVPQVYIPAEPDNAFGFDEAEAPAPAPKKPRKPRTKK